MFADGTVLVLGGPAQFFSYLDRNPYQHGLTLTAPMRPTPSLLTHSPILYQLETQRGRHPGRHQSECWRTHLAVAPADDSDSA